MEKTHLATTTAAADIAWTRFNKYTDHQQSSNTTRKYA